MVGGSALRAAAGRRASVRHAYALRSGVPGLAGRGARTDAARAHRAQRHGAGRAGRDGLLALQGRQYTVDALRHTHYKGRFFFIKHPFP